MKLKAYLWISILYFYNVCNYGLFYSNLYFHFIEVSLRLAEIAITEIELFSFPWKIDVQFQTHEVYWLHYCWRNWLHMPEPYIIKTFIVKVSSSNNFVVRRHLIGSQVTVIPRVFCRVNNGSSTTWHHCNLVPTKKKHLIFIP